MANRTRSDIKNIIYDFMPKINQSGKATLLNACIDLAVEEISNAHDFRALREKTPDTATLSAGSYYLDLNSTNFTTMCASTTPFKSIRIMRLMKSGTDDYGTIRFLDDITFHEKYGYVDYTSRSRGDPIHYTIIEDRILFNCPAQDASVVRCYYQKTHGAFSGDSMSHLFATRSDFTATFYIVYRALLELKMSMNTAEFPQELQGVAELTKKYATDLVAQDNDVPDEEFEIGWAERSDTEFATDDYGWVT